LDLLLFITPIFGAIQKKKNLCTMSTNTEAVLQDGGGLWELLPDTEMDHQEHELSKSVERNEDEETDKEVLDESTKEAHSLPSLEDQVWRWRWRS
jgi:hypothetical protein